MHIVKITKHRFLECDIHMEELFNQFGAFDSI